MRASISNRHRGNLGGRLTDIRLPAKVTLLLAPEVAGQPVAQHLVWMLLNLLSRQTREIQQIELLVPEGVKLAGRLSPLMPLVENLDAALRAGVRAIHPEVLLSKPQISTHVTVRVGPGPLAGGDFALATTAVGWSGYVGQYAVDEMGQETHPIGAYVAASLCAGEIFKFVRGMRPEAGDFVNRLWLNAATLELSEHPPSQSGPVFPEKFLLPSAIIAGVGAVGNGFLHTLFALPEANGELTLLDYDREGITDTNLNRYVLFGLSHLGAPKATTAGKLLAGGPMNVHPIDTSWSSWWEAWGDQHPDTSLPLVISAVDTNASRHAIQDALPQLILGASTNEMRAQVTTYDIWHGGPCLRCRNPKEQPRPDTEIIKYLQNLSIEARAQRAVELGLNPDDLEVFLRDPGTHCGLISGARLQEFNSLSEDEAHHAEWSVGFVSLLAGVLLATEYLKLNLEGAPVALDAQRNTFRFQFWSPEKTAYNRVIELPPAVDCFCQTSTFQRVIKVAQQDTGK